jgi:hypothetical protein
VPDRFSLGLHGSSLVSWALELLAEKPSRTGREGDREEEEEEEQQEREQQEGDPVATDPHTAATAAAELPATVRRVFPFPGLNLYQHFSLGEGLTHARTHPELIMTVVVTS